MDWKSDKYAKKTRRMDAGYFIMQVTWNKCRVFVQEDQLVSLQLCLNFFTHTSRYPLDKKKDGGGDIHSSDVCTLENLRLGLAEAFALKEKTLPQSAVAHLARPALSPSCAVVGGVLAQEVIKAISGKDAPHDNFFVYNPLSSSGVVERIGYEE